VIGFDTIRILLIATYLQKALFIFAKILKPAIAVKSYE